MGKTCKVVVCGMKGVGKTAILEQAVYGNITQQSVSEAQWGALLGFTVAFEGAPPNH